MNTSMQHQKRAVVVGGAGFIGSNIVDGLLSQGYDVAVIDNLVEGKRENVHESAQLHVLDILDKEAIAPVIAGADVVFHLAALPRVQYSIENPIESNEVNVRGTLNVLTCAKEGKVGRVVYSASSAAYGDQPIMPFVESMLPQPQSPYGLQKYIGEHYCRIFSELYQLETVSLRYFNVYGPRLSSDGAYALVIGKFLKQRAEGVPLSITGDGHQTRDFTHVRDVVRANILAAESDQVGAGEVINIGAGVETSINTLASYFGGSVEHIAPRQEPKRTLSDSSLAKRLLNWEPTVSLKVGIEELLMGTASAR